MTDHSHNLPASQPPARARCVVWQSPAKPAPKGLMRALESKGLDLARANDPYSALANLLRASRAQEVVVLVIVEPRSHARCDELLATLDRYAPRAARWTFDSQQDPMLQVARPKAAPTPVERSTTEQRIAEPKPARAAELSAQPGPMLRLTGLGVLGAAMHDSEPTNGSAAESVLTSEEMAALLGDEPGDYDPAQGGRP